jgi:hypothetical protein
MRLQSKVAIVTGAASAFGAGIARRFAAEAAGATARKAPMSFGLSMRPCGHSVGSAVERYSR